MGFCTLLLTCTSSLPRSLGGGPIRTIFVRLNDFQNYFTVRKRRKFVIILSLKIPPNLKCVVTEWGKMSQRFIDRAIGHWRRRLECILQQQGGHREHLM